MIIVRQDIHVVTRVRARAHRHKHAYGETFTCKLAGPSPPKRYLLKASPPASTAVAVVTVARPHACAHVRVSSHVCIHVHARLPAETAHSLRRIANARSLYAISHVEKEE